MASVTNGHQATRSDDVHERVIWSGLVQRSRRSFRFSVVEDLIG